MLLPHRRCSRDLPRLSRASGVVLVTLEKRPIVEGQRPARIHRALAHWPVQARGVPSRFPWANPEACGCAVGGTRRACLSGRRPSLRQPVADDMEHPLVAHFPPGIFFAEVTSKLFCCPFLLCNWVVCFFAMES